MKKRPIGNPNESCAVSVEAAQSANQQARGGANPTTALHSLRVAPIPFAIASQIVIKNHYLHTMPGGTTFCFGIFLTGRLLGALTLGSGPAMAYRIVEGAKARDCATLTRLWLSDELPQNSESKVISVVLRALRRQKSLKFIVSYADPAQGHLGTIYQATGWLYTGVSSATPLYDIGDGKPRHSRSLSHAYGTHSVAHFKRNGVEVRLVPQSAKHRYVYFLDPTWKTRLKVQDLPYPKPEVPHESD